jgi:hypothetical protein
MSLRPCRFTRPASVLALLCTAGLLLGAKRPAASPSPGQFNPDHQTVELFAAVEAGQIEVRFIPKDSKLARILIENKTAAPLNVRLPEAFAALPVLAQFQPGGNNPFGNQGNNPFGAGQGQGQGQGNAGGNQAVGGGLNQGQNGGGQNGMFNVAAEKVGVLKVACVCLEHGKAEPRAAIPYRMVPIEQFTSDRSVHALLTAFARDDFDQRAAQAAAWHLAGGMSWDELAEKRIRHLVGPSRPYFSKEELEEARTIVGKASAGGRQGGKGTRRHGETKTAIAVLKTEN